MTFAAFDRATVGQRDRISVRDLVHEVEIGAFQSERGMTQRVGFNVVVEVSDAEQPIGDDVDRILSYDTITDAVAQALAEQRLNLLETLAERIAAILLAEPQAQRVFLQIQKLDRGPFALGVEIVRDKAQATAQAQSEERVRPVVVHLSNAALGDVRLATWLDQMVESGLPLMLTVDRPDIARPVAQHVAAQDRIDMLAIEQAAWVLAGLEPRCAVVETRTEIEWALMNRHLTVWAPAKMVLDAVEGPAGTDPAVLSVWCARHLGAERMVFLGATPPAKAALPTRRTELTDSLDLT